MNRQEAVSLLKEIMTECESFHTASSVSIYHNVTKDNWELHVNWIAPQFETDCLKKILAKYSLEMVVTNERTIFRSI